MLLILHFRGPEHARFYQQLQGWSTCKAMRRLGIGGGAPKQLRRVEDDAAPYRACRARRRQAYPIHFQLDAAGIAGQQGQTSYVGGQAAAIFDAGSESG